MIKKALRGFLGAVGLLPWIRRNIQWRLMARAMRRRYAVHIARIRRQKTIRTLFLVSENSKWCAQSLYDALEADGRFQPFIVTASIFRPGQTAPERAAEYEVNRRFFTERGMRVLDGFDAARGEDIDLQGLGPDIVFYQQPWGLSPIHAVDNVGRFALTCYLPYGLQTSNFDNVHYHILFQRLIWRTFTFSQASKDMFRRKAPEGDRNVEAFGYPKLDVYLEDRRIDDGAIWSLSKAAAPGIKRIIWAPHHAFDDLCYATFLWNYRFFLDYARAHPRTDWILKPHPRLRFALREHLAADEVDDFFRQWAQLPNARIYELGDYFDIMRTSDAMITDCGSFLGEYLPTGKPILHLINPASLGFNEIGRLIAKDLYRIHDTAELDKMIQRVIIEGDDFLKAARMQALSLLGTPGRHAGREIARFLRSALAA